jgi:hypothetical protein
MGAGLYNFVIEQGATLNFELQYKDSNGEPIDLSGYTGKMEIASNYLGQTPRTVYATLNSITGSFPTGSGLVSGSFLSFSGSNFTTPPSSGSIGVYMGYYTTDNLSFTGSAYYDLEITTGPTRTRLLQGQVQLSRQITNS